MAFTVVDRKDPAYHKEGSVALEPGDRAYLETLLAELRAVALRDKVPELEDFAKQIEQLLKDAELGKISKEHLLDALAKAEEKMNQGAELSMPLTKKGKRRLRRALGGGRRAIARYEVSATGGGGGTEVVSGSLKQRR